MFYIIEGENGKFLGMKEEVEFFLVSEMENATVLNKSSLDGLLKWKEQDGEIKTEDGSMKIAYIHTLGTTCIPISFKTELHLFHTTSEISLILTAIFMKWKA